MKVKPLFDLTQQIGTISVTRIAGFPFDLDPEVAKNALKAGVIETLEDFPKKKQVPKNMETI